MDDTPDLEIVELRDAAETAERAVAHWQARVQENLDAVRRLGGFFSWLEGTILGTRQRQLDEVVAAVERARQRLDQALHNRDEALARLAAAEQDRVDRAAADEARRARREDLADQVRVATHPLARAFNELEARLDTLRLEHDAVRRAYLVGTSLVASLRSAMGRHERPTPFGLVDRDESHEPTFDPVLAQRLERQARDFEDACAVMGLSVSVRVAAPVRDRLGSFVRTWGHSLVTGAVGHLESQQFQASLEGALHETDGALAPILATLEGLRNEIDDLEQQRDVILDRFDR